ncbi:short-chain dehydrogenase [Pseudoalteromonas sp. T1lg75]|uniref:short-chain dehydrogenase n=1 Tax=Pseudoalteromonas sp. T1lg75 TaxID=2077102 RepID=UPI000CF6CE97|nr:short-chain dehydrogenase [Pseudoalteromonas sp. T1lg75]
MKKMLFAFTLAASAAFSSAQAWALELSATDVEKFIKAAPAVTNWADSQADIDASTLLGAQQEQQGDNTTADNAMIDSAIGMLKDNAMYQEFATLLSAYGFTPEQLVSVGSEISSAYLANIKGNLSAENQQTVDQVMGGLQSLSGSKNSDSNSLFGSLAKANETSEEEISDNNLSVVSEYMPQLQQLFSAFVQ